MRIQKAIEERFIQRRERIVPLQPSLNGVVKHWSLELADAAFVEEWRLLKTSSGKMHIVGRFSPRGRLNASVPLASLNLVPRSVVTMTGRKLRLQGEPGCAAVGKCVASLYGVFDRRLLDAQDVTDAFVSLTSK